MGRAFCYTSASIMSSKRAAKPTWELDPSRLRAAMVRRVERSTDILRDAAVASELKVSAIEGDAFDPELALRNDEYSLLVASEALERVSEKLSAARDTWHQPVPRDSLQIQKQVSGQNELSQSMRFIATPPPYSSLPTFWLTVAKSVASSARSSSALHGPLPRPALQLGTVAVPQ